MFQAITDTGWTQVFTEAFGRAFQRRVARLLVDWEWSLESGVSAIRAENRRSRRVSRLVLPRNTFLLDPGEVAERAADRLYVMLRDPSGPPSIAFY